MKVSVTSNTLSLLIALYAILMWARQATRLKEYIAGLASHTATIGVKVSTMCNTALLALTPILIQLQILRADETPSSRLTENTILDEL